MSQHLPASGRPLSPARERRAAAVAGYVPRGARVLALGADSAAVAAHLPPECEVLDTPPRGAAGALCDVEGGQLPQADCDVVVALDLLERAPDLAGLVRQLRGYGRPVIASYAFAGEGATRATGAARPCDRDAFAVLVGQSGFTRVYGQELGAGEVLLRLDPSRPVTPQEKDVWVLSCANLGNFGDRLGVHVLSEVLPANACVRHVYYSPFEPPPEGAPDLLIVGIGNSIYHETLNDDLFRLLQRAPLAVGIFGTQYREAIPRPRLDALLDRLHLWYARFEADALLFGRGRSNVRHLGDWLIHAVPMSHPTRDEELRIGEEAWDDLPLDRYIAHIQSYSRVGSPRLHPLLCALTSAEQVAYVEQYDFGAVGPSGKFRSMLIDVFGREQAAGVYWPVDRPSVASYKEKVAQNLAGLRAELARLLS